jgi:hypothetical protein
MSRPFGNSKLKQPQQLVNKRNAIKLGVDQLVNLDAPEAEEKKRFLTYSEKTEKMNQKFNRHHRAPEKTNQDEKSNTKESPSSFSQKIEEEKKPERKQQPEINLQQQQYYQNQYQYQRREPFIPPEARLARWSFVFKNIFPTFLSNEKSSSSLSSKSSVKKLKTQNRQKTLLLLEALERIDRWKRVAASQGLMMRLRKIPAYIEATKPLVEAIQMDRKLQEMREELWKEQEEEHQNQEAGDEEEDLDDSDNENEKEEIESDQEEDDEQDEKLKNQQGKPSSSSSTTTTLSFSALANQQITAASLPSIYANAITRAVFELTESNRKFSDQLDSNSTFRQRSQNIELPEELAEARNQISHGRMPTLAQLRFAASLGLQYLHDFFWVPKSEALKEYRVAKEDFDKNEKLSSNQNKDDSASSTATPFSGQMFGMRRQREEEVKRLRQQQQDNSVSNESASDSVREVIGEKKTKLSLEEMKAKMQQLKK